MKFVRYNNLYRIFRNKKNLKVKKILITKSVTARREEKLKEAQELQGFRNVWANDGKIFCKLEANGKPRFYYG